MKGEKVNFINISGSSQTKDSYTNFDIKLQNFKGHWMTTLRASVGKFAYKVDSDGFVVYNTNDEYKYSAGVKINYALTKKENISFGFRRSKFNDSNVNIYLISYSYTF